MEANTRHLERIFDPTIQYQVPLFQRPYVWTEEKNWEPLWEDIETLLSKHLRGDSVHPHFLGAVVLEQLANPTGSIESRQVIDGQQRFTTLQLFLIAARDLARQTECTKYADRLADLVANRPNRIDDADEVFKVWPTNSDRPAFRLVHEAGSLDGIEKSLKLDPHLKRANIIGAYRYFHSKLTEWFAGEYDDEDDEDALRNKSAEDRWETLWQVIKGCLQVVVIDLDKDDETQVIFETLNARGEDLLPADLIKNFLFRWASSVKVDTEKLFENYWQRFDQKFWRDEVKQGRISRPRIDVFINHYLTLMTREEVKSAHLFNAFKTFAKNAVRPEGSLIPVPTTPSEHIAQLARYSEVFESLHNPGEHPRLVQFLGILDAVDTTTVYPFLLHAYAELMPDDQDELDEILAVLESFLMRRMICGMTNKSYNRLFVDLIRAIEKVGEISAKGVSTQLLRGGGESTRFPSDHDLRAAVFDSPLYGRLAQKRVRVILETLNAFDHNAKSEDLKLPPKLTIEHVMPRGWQEHWPLPSHVVGDPIEEQHARARRDRLIDTLGNLTLVTSSLNPALSNSGWETKRPELLRFSKLNLTRYFYELGSSPWDEAAIVRRTEYLFGQLIQVWPDLERLEATAAA